MQLTSPVPDASACSASNPSAIWPVADTAVPPLPAAVTVATAPGVDTVSGLPLAGVLAAEGLPAGVAAAPPMAAGAARIWLNVAVPVDVAVPAAPDLTVAACAGTAIIEIWAAAEPGAAGGQDLLMDVTAASWPTGPVT